MWSVKNYLTTSCLIFPVAFSCFPSLWSNKYLAISQNEELRFFHKAYNINSESVFDWYFKWSDRYLNYYVSINLFVSLLIIILFLHIFFKFSNKKNGINFFYFYLYIIFVNSLDVVSSINKIWFGYFYTYNFVLFVVFFRFTISKIR